MRYVLLPLTLWCVGCSSHPHQTHSPELKAELDQREGLVIGCLKERGALSPRRKYSPEVIIEDTCYFYKSRLWVKGYTDHRNYIQVGSDRAALEHEWGAFHSNTHVHCPKTDPDCEALTNACGDRLSRQWRKTHERLPCIDNRPKSIPLTGSPNCAATLP